MPQVTLETDQLWRGHLYPAGLCTIPDDLAAAMGLSGTHTPPPAVVEPDDAEPLPALTLINEAANADAMTPIPTVGPGAAKVIFDNRPSGGYPSLDALPKAIFAQPYRCDLTQITSWAG